MTKNIREKYGDEIVRKAEELDMSPSSYVRMIQMDKFWTRVIYICAGFILFDLLEWVLWSYGITIIPEHKTVLDLLLGIVKVFYDVVWYLMGLVL